MAIYPPDVAGRNREQTTSLFPVLIGKDESQPGISWQVALPQSLPPLRRPRRRIADLATLDSLLFAKTKTVEWKGRNQLFSFRLKPSSTGCNGLLASYTERCACWNRSSKCE